MTPDERADLTAWRWWRPDELEATADDLVPRDLAARLRKLAAHGPPPAPIEIGV
ncbi:MAG TPA: hypothetical protein VFH80_26285 [Solirubrobacteraceae bacterium]|nr:hypothetical protein [Solirubrobacteraceae bacterium]